MILLWSLSVLLLIPGLIESKPGYYSFEDWELIEGDILIPKSRIHREKRHVTNVPSLKWTNNTLTYNFANDISTSKRKLIQKAMAYISSQTCIQFCHNDNPQGEYVKIVNGEGCYSYVGMVGRGQNLSIEDACQQIGDIVHELMHALGVFHTHTRYDRDKYIYIDIGKNANTAWLSQYEMEKSNYTYLPVPYEYGSVMHYSSDSIHGIKMIARQDEFQYTMGSARVSMYDMKTLNIHYGCGCKKDLLCRNGGYTNPSTCSSCICPSGYGGLLCNQSPTGAIELQASSTWQSWVSTFSRMTPELYDIFTTQTIIINGAFGKMIEVNVLRMDGFDETWGCPWNGVEFKKMEDQVLVSPVACYKSSVGTYYRGAVQRMPILFYNRYFGRKITFGFRYRII